MPTANKIEVNISGDNYGNIIIGDNNIIGTPNGIKINKIKEQSKFERRTKPINLRPRAFPNLLGRANELGIIQNAIANETPVTLFGENGIGKTSLIRQASHLPENKKFKDGVVYLTALGEERDDVLQQLFDSIYVGTPNHKPTDAQIRNDLKNIHALIFLDDLTLKREEVTTLLDAMPKSLFILASDERVLWGEGQTLGLDGLPENESIQLFERELGRKLHDDEKPVAIQICKILLFHPLRILQSASLMREEGQSIQQVFTSLTKTKTQSAPLEVTVQKSNETQKKILSLLAVAGGFALTREHLAKLAGSVNFDADIKSLLGRGIVESQGATFSLSNESVKSLIQLWDLSGWEDSLINHFSTWLQTAPQDMLVDQVASTLFHLIQRAGEKKQWKNVVVIGKRLEQFYALKKKWDGWLKILKLIQLAAKYLKDQYLEGWALHQLGSRALCLDLKTEASELLNQALKIRKAIGDKGGLEVTQHNLNLLLNVPVAKSSVRSNLKRTNALPKIFLFGGMVGGILLFIFLGGVILLNLLPDSVTPTITVVIPDTKVPTETIVITETSILPTPTFTRATFTPSVITTLTPIVLFDFVRGAPKATWTLTKNVDTFDEIVEELNFPTIITVSDATPEDYGSFYAPYIGLAKSPKLEDGSSDELALLTYPHESEAALSGSYDLTWLVLQEGDEFVAHVGHVFPSGEFPTTPESVEFMVTFYEFDSSPVVIASQEDFYDGKTHTIRFPITSKLAGKSGVFVLEVYSLEGSFSDWAVWIDAELRGLPR